MTPMFVYKDCSLYEPSNWFIFRWVNVDGDAPVRVEAPKWYVEKVLGVPWMDRAARQRALAEAISRIEDQVFSCAGVDANGHRFYRLG